MPKQITSNEWHLRGVSLEVREAIMKLGIDRHQDQGPVVDELLRIVLTQLKLL